MKNVKIAFFGTPQYSILVLEKLYKKGYPVVLVVTKPAQPVGRKKILTPSPVAVWAKKHNLPLLRPLANAHKPWLFANEQETVNRILDFKPEILITADYTQKIPRGLVQKTKYGGLNIHPSLLPSYRGPAPVPWAILNGETETGVSIVTLTEKFDQGKIVAQEKEPIISTNTTDSLLTKLFAKGGELLVKILPDYISNPNYDLRTKYYELITPSYFPRLTRDDGYIPLRLIQAAIQGKSISLLTMKQFNNLTIIKAAMYNKKEDEYQIAPIVYRAWRALHPWPGLWTKVKLAVGSGQLAEKRLKILRCCLTANRELQTANLVLDEIQLEGKKPVDFEDFRQAYQYNL